MTSLSQILHLNAIAVVAIALATSISSANGSEPEKHWSLQPIERAELPPGVHPVDWFIQAGLEVAEVKQNAEADRAILQRRATLDLTGLPPTREEMAEFAADTGEGAWERLVDRLLASPHYGERWGRHWLDVARYVQGTIKVPGIDRIDLAEDYRDYVVESFNSDKPYDRFVTEQLAGDLLAGESESKEEYLERITAPAFLSIGPWFEECTDPNKLKLDIVDEQISTLTRAFLAMDFACSRCHDHKFDPIPTTDYYALAGIFRSTRITDWFADEWKDGRPRAVQAVATEEERAALASLEAGREDLRRERFELLRKARNRIVAKHPDRAAAPLTNVLATIEAEDFSGHKNLKVVPLGDGEAVTTRRLLDQWIKFRIEVPEPGDYALFVRYAAETEAPVELEINSAMQEGEVPFPPTHGGTAEHFSWNVVTLPGLKQGANHFRLLVDRHRPFPTLDCLELVRASDAPSPERILEAHWPPTPAMVEGHLDGDDRTRLESIDARISSLDEAEPDHDLTLVVSEADTMIDLPVHIGGNTYQTEDTPVPRAVPTLAEQVVKADFSIPNDESGRLQLAHWLMHSDHPLTARVMTNRIWHWHFGVGLVRTVDDFGKQGSLPTHPELLDWLAAEFVESGWSVKHLHRIIMTSATYRASSRETPENLARDPDGALYSRFPGRRLEVEAIYDGMLTSIGKVARQEAGSPLDTSGSKDRALYILTSSRSPMGLGIEIRKMFPLFGFDPSGRPMHDRDESVTPNQALWWLNNPVPRYYATELARQACGQYVAPSDRVRHIHETILGLPVNEEAEGAILDYIHRLQADQGLSEEEAWTRACLGLFSSRTFSHLE